MEQGKDGQRGIHAERTEDIVEREEWYGYTLEARLDGRWVRDPRFLAAHLTIQRDGGPRYGRDVDVHSLRLQGFDIRSALRYVIKVSKSVIAILNTH
ncbi:hypothetical protein [Dyella sp. 20L07]|uniref:hypothetical protein n=1 Tax=Dyella sp. 20L07 TaxID=3384240 RepID=UPI003D2E8959